MASSLYSFLLPLPLSHSLAPLIDEGPSREFPDRPAVVDRHPAISTVGRLVVILYATRVLLPRLMRYPTKYPADLTVRATMV